MTADDRTPARDEPAARVLKWAVRADDQWHPVGSGRVLHVDRMSESLGRVEVWTLEPVDQLGSPLNRVGAAIVIGTGHQVPVNSEPLGSVVYRDKAIVWHVFRARAPMISDALSDTQDGHLPGDAERNLK